MDILSPSARRRYDFVTSQMTLALALFYIMALVLYYSTPRVYLESPRIPVLAQAPAYTEVEKAPEAPSTIYFVFSPDFAVGLLVCLKLIVAVSITAHLAVFLHEGGCAAAQRRRSRDPPLYA